MIYFTNSKGYFNSRYYFIMHRFSFLRSKVVVVFLILVSIGCLYPGLTLPMMSLQIVASLPLVGDIELYNQTQSIWSGIVELFNKDYVFVAFLIFLFSIAVPLFKLMCLTVILLFESSKLAQTLYQIVLLIGKWSMADVFVVAIFISFLAGEAKPDVYANLHSGFYWFLSYCVISIFCGQLLKINK